MKWTFLTVILIFSFTLVSAQDRELKNQQTIDVNYSDSVTFKVSCNSGSCPLETSSATNRAELYVCSSKAGEVVSYYGSTKQYPIEYTVNIPDDAPCSLGNHTMEVNGDKIGGLNVSAKGMPSNKGKYMGVEIDELSGTNTIELQGFFLTDDQSNPIGSGIPEPGIQLRRPRVAGPEEAWASVDLGILENNINQSIIDQCGTSGGSAFACNVADRYDLGSISANDLQKSNYVDSISNITPLHNDFGNFEVQGDTDGGNKGQVMVGKDAETSSNQKDFFVCREEGKKHRVLWNGNVYRCDTNSNGNWEWQKPNYEAEIIFYNKPNNSIVGFHPKLPIGINTYDLSDKWEDAYGTDIDHGSELEVKAECWRGKPEQRPIVDRDILTLETEWGGGNAYVAAGKLPGRSWGNHDRSTGYNRYSCNFGFQQDWNNPTGLQKHNGKLVSGSPSRGPFRVTVTSKSLNEDSAVDLTNWVSTQTTTNTKDSNPDIFQNFPNSEEPCEVWQNNVPGGLPSSTC